MDELRMATPVAVKRAQANYQAKQTLIQDVLSLETQDKGVIVEEEKLNKKRSQMMKSNAKRIEDNHRLNKYLQENTDLTVREFDSLLINEMKAAREFPTVRRPKAMKNMSANLFKQIRGGKSSKRSDTTGSVSSILSGHSSNEGAVRDSLERRRVLPRVKTAGHARALRDPRRRTMGGPQDANLPFHVRRQSLELHLGDMSKIMRAGLEERKFTEGRVRSFSGASRTSKTSKASRASKGSDKGVIASSPREAFELKKSASQEFSGTTRERSASVGDVVIEMDAVEEVAPESPLTGDHDKDFERNLTLPSVSVPAKAKLPPPRTLEEEVGDLLGKGLSYEEAQVVAEKRVEEDDKASLLDEMLSDVAANSEVIKSIQSNESIWWTTRKHLPTTEEGRLKYASSLILDAIIGRKLKRRRLGNFPMFIYKTQTHPFYVKFLLWVIMLHNLMIFFEPPSFFKMGTINASYKLIVDLNHILYDYKLGKYNISIPLRFLVGYEMIFVAFYVAHTISQSYSLGFRDYVLKKWGIVSLLITVCMVVDVLVAITIGSPLIVFGMGNPIRFSRLLRPILLIIHYKSLRRISSTVLRTMPLVFDVFLIIAIFFLMYAIIGMQLFMDEYEGDNFKDFPNAMLSLLVLITTENYPSVMYPAFSRAGYFSVLYFVIFIGIGTLILMNVLSAVLFDSYLTQHRRRVMNERIKERRTLLAAFNCIDHENLGEISFETWEKLSYYLRKDIGIARPEVLFYALDRDGNGSIDTLEFFDLADVIQMKFKMINDSKYSLAKYLPKGFKKLSNRFYQRQTRKMMSRIAQSNIYNGLIFLLILLNTMLLCVHYRGIDEYPDVITALNITDFVFQIVLMAEIIFRIFALGPKKFWKSRWNIFDFATTSVSMVATLGNIFLFKEIGRSSFILSIRLLRLLRTMRSIRLFSTSQRFRILTSTMITLLPIFFNLMTLELVVFYSYAVIGMEFYQGIYEGDPNPPQETFDNIGRTFLTLFQLFTTSNWHEPMYSIMDKTYFVSCLYFVSFEYLAAIILINILLAVTLEIFTIQREMKMSYDDDDDAVPSLEVDDGYEDFDEFEGSEGGVKGEEGLEIEHSDEGSGESDSGQSPKPAQASDFFIVKKKRRWFRELVKDDEDEMYESEIKKLDKLTPIRLDQLLEQTRSSANVSQTGKDGWMKIKKFALSPKSTPTSRVDSKAEMEMFGGDTNEKSSPVREEDAGESEDSELEAIVPKDEKTTKLKKVATLTRKKALNDKQQMSFSSLVIETARQEVKKIAANENKDAEESANKEEAEEKKE